MNIVREFHIKLTLDKRAAIAALAVFFLCWHPGFIGSETLQLTTYYPAPYGGYVSILTTGNTTLSRDTGNVMVGSGTPTQKLHVSGNSKTTGTVYWGANRGTLNTDQGASIELGGIGTPYIDFSRTATEDYSSRIILSQANRLQVVNDLQVTRDMYVNRDMTVTRDLYVNRYIRNFCTRRSYSVGATAYCPGGYQLVGYYGNGAARVSGFLPASATTSSAGTYIVLGEDWGGTMVCCRYY